MYKVLSRKAYIVAFILPVSILDPIHQTFIYLAYHGNEIVCRYNNYVNYDLIGPLPVVFLLSYLLKSVAFEII